MDQLRKIRKQKYDRFIKLKTKQNDLAPLETNAQEALNILIDFMVPDYFAASAMNQNQLNTCMVSTIMSTLLKE